VRGPAQKPGKQLGQHEHHEGGEDHGREPHVLDLNPQPWAPTEEYGDAEEHDDGREAREVHAALEGPQMALGLHAAARCPHRRIDGGDLGDDKRQEAQRERSFWPAV